MPEVSPMPERIRRYAISSLDGTPAVLHALLNGILPSEADFRPDPERFTLREALAHMADWEPIWLERLRLIAEADPSQSVPFLRGYDESQWAIDHHYDRANVWEQVTKFADGRQQLVAYLQTVPVAAWAKVGEHGEIGPLTFAQLVTLVLAHDGYHLRQVADFRKLYAGRNY